MTKTKPAVIVRTRKERIIPAAIRGFWDILFGTFGFVIVWGSENFMNIGIPIIWGVVIGGICYSLKKYIKPDGTW